MSCPSCGNAVPEQASFCPECGVPVEGVPEVSRRTRRDTEVTEPTGQVGGRETVPSHPAGSVTSVAGLRALRDTSEAAPNALLARANLLRMRGQWTEAVECCTAALQADAQSAAAHSLLGDIYENQGRLDKAVHWYQLALEHNPHSIADQAKLARARELQAVRRRAGSSRLSWAYLVAVAGVAFLFIAFVMAAIAAADRGRAATTAVAQSPLPEYPRSLAPREQPADHTSEEEAIVTFLRERLNSRYMLVSGVLLNPDERSATVTVQMTGVEVPPDEMGGSPRVKILREGYRIAELTREQQRERKQDLRFVTIRALARLSSSSGTGPTVDVWRGRVDVTRLGARDNQASAREVEAVYDRQRMFWSPLSGL